MSAIEVTTQAQLDNALKNLKRGDYVVCLGGTWNRPLVVSGSASVRAYDSASVRASDSALVRAYDSASVTATPYVAVHRYITRYGTPTVNGGVLIDVPDAAELDGAGWCDYYGVKMARGQAVLYKAVDDDYSTPEARQRGIFYTPGAKVAAADWNPKPRCGNGLHVCARPWIARRYNADATRYVQVRVKVADLVVIDDKAKVPALSVLAECDLDGVVLRETPAREENE